jgi:hypothetical protein
MADNENVWVAALRSSVKWDDAEPVIGRAFARPVGIAQAAPRPGHKHHAASALSTSLTQYDVSNTSSGCFNLTG